MEQGFEKLDADRQLKASTIRPSKTARLVSNPPNPWLSQHSEYLEEVPAAELEVYEETAKSILSRNHSSDIPFQFSINPYRGCFHACAYCYARPSHEYLGLGAGSDFDFKITAKINAPALLKQAFERQSWQGERICFSGVTDPYQPLEASYQLTRQCLEICLDYSNPVSIITKAVIIERDLDLLTDLAQKSSVEILYSLPFYCSETARKIEVAAPTPQRRLRAIEKLAAAGLPVGILIAPLIPGLNDKEARKILAAARSAGACSADFLLLRLPGSVEAVFRQRIREQFPTQAKKILNQLSACRGGVVAGRGVGQRMSGEGHLYRAINDLMTLMIRQQNFPGWPAKPTQSPFKRPKSNQNKPRKNRNDNPNQLQLFAV